MSMENMERACCAKHGEIAVPPVVIDGNGAWSEPSHEATAFKTRCSRVHIWAGLGVDLLGAPSGGISPNPQLHDKGR